MPSFLRPWLAHFRIVEDPRAACIGATDGSRLPSRTVQRRARGAEPYVTASESRRSRRCMRRAGPRQFGSERAMDAKTTAFLGLGVIGSPMAGHLARAGHHIT